MHFSITPYLSSLPAGSIAEKVNATLADHNAIVVTAPPGAGKSTLLPLTIHNGLASANEKIILLEPRRIAARQIAERMAQMTNTKLGEEIGYRVRFENRTSSLTRIEVLTEGMLTRMIADDPTLDGISTVIFDEFHERSLITDTALALVLETQKTIRPDLRIVIMSATIDTETICRMLNAPLIESQGRMYDIDIRYAEEATMFNCVEVTARAISRACRETEGNILAFLPGQAEIKRCAEMIQSLQNDSLHICPLYGQLSVEEQRRAILPTKDGIRKIVLATPIAETSLTIEGVTVVVDSGLCRRLVYDPRSALERLQTVRISMDMARQRSGRAGRLAPGVCYRLWTKATEARMADCREPEILSADLSSLVLDIAAWGGNDIEQLPWITPPPQANIIQANKLLLCLGAIDNNGHITPHGKRLSILPCHPRIAQMLTIAETTPLKALAADIAALLEEKDPMAQDTNADINDRITTLREIRKRKKTGTWQRIIHVAEQYRRLVHASEDNMPLSPYDAGKLIANAYPERIAIAEGNATFLLANGERVTLDTTDDLHACHTLAVASLGKRIFLASPVSEDTLQEIAISAERLLWDSKQGRVSAVREQRIGHIVLESNPIDIADRNAAMDIAVNVVKKEGLSLLNFNDDTARLQRRLATVANWHKELALPDVSSEQLLHTADSWLPMYLNGPITAAEIKRIDLTAVIWGMLTYEQQQTVERLAPTHITVPTNSRIRLDYRNGADAPVLSVRLQECFGMTDTPRVDDGSRPILMELLSPGFKPVQLTQDLRSFWNGTYFEVRKEMKRRYPKHYWPDNPLEAQAVRGVKRNT